MSRLPSVASSAQTHLGTSTEYIFGDPSRVLSNEEILGRVRYLHSKWTEIPDSRMRIIASLQDFRLRCKGKQSVYALWPDGVFSLLLFPRWRRAPWQTQLVHAYKEAKFARHTHFLICMAVRGGKV
jgi:hypothetical protein